MALWRYSVGNLLARAAADPTALAGDVNPVLPLSRLRDGYSDAVAGMLWAEARDSSGYELSLPMNLLRTSSARVDSPSGWTDLALALAGTPGIPTNFAQWTTLDGRYGIIVFRPTYQDVQVLPGEHVYVAADIELPVASMASAVRLRVVNLTTGKGWSSVGEWVADGVAMTSAATSWVSFARLVEPDPACTEITTYRIILDPVGSDPAAGYFANLTVCGEFDTIALIGHNMPSEAVVHVDAVTFETVGGYPVGFVAAFDSPLTPTTAVLRRTTAAIAKTLSLSVQNPARFRAPEIAEIWVGMSRQFTRSPMSPINWRHADFSQMRVETSSRTLVVSDRPRPVGTYALEFLFHTEEGYQQLKQEIFHLTSGGTDPILLLPDNFEGDRPLFGRIGAELSLSRTDTVPQHITKVVLEFFEQQLP